MRRLPLLTLVGAAIVCLVPALAFADHITLKNGDALTGRVTSTSASEVVIDTELVGRVTVPRSAIGELQQTDAAAASQTQATAPAWHGSVNSGLDLSRGNAETRALSTFGGISRLGPRDRLGLFGTSLFSSIGSGTDAVTTARSVRGGARYDHDLVGPLYGFGFGDLEHDALQLLDLRTVGGGGAGVHLLKTGASQFNLFGGVSFAHDTYAENTSETTATTTETTSGATTTTTTTLTTVTHGNSGTTAAGTTPGRSGSAPGKTVVITRRGTPPPVVRTELSRTVGEFLAGQDASHQFSDSVSLDERFVLFPAVGDFEDYRVSLDVSLSARLNSWLQWNVNVSDRYLHIPPAGGAVQNDTWISTGLGITFGNGSGIYSGTEARRPRR